MSGITKPVCGQYFGIFLVSKESFDKIVDSAPFDKTNLLLVAFVHTYKKDGKYVADYENARDKGAKPNPGDYDADRIDYLVSKARAENPNIKIVISLGWGKNDVDNAALTPNDFADSVKALVERHKLDGFDIDYESESVSESDMLTLTNALRTALTADKIMTITPAQTSGLNSKILDIFDLVMPQTYDHGGNGTTADWYQQTLGGYSKIVFGLNSEGAKGSSDDPAKFAKLAKDNNAAGIFAWRLDTDTQVNGFPTFKTAEQMWALMETQGTLVYLYTAQNPSRYYYATNPADSPGHDWSQSGIAFIALGPGIAGAIPVRQHSADNPQRYSYDVTGTLAPGWTDDNKTSFYAFKTQGTNTVPVYQYHTILPGGLWNLAYSPNQNDPNLADWTNDGPAFYVPTNDRLYGRDNHYLTAGDALVSSQNKYKLSYQGDGNLVIYGLSDGKAIWASNTDGNPAWRTYMQPDGNFVIYKSDGNPIWASKTPNHSDSVIIMQDDGNLVIYDSSGIAIWASNTAA